MKEIIVNKLATRTWNRLGVNEARLSWDENEKILPDTLIEAKPSECPAPIKVEVLGDGEFSAKTIKVDAAENSTLTVFEIVKANDNLFTKLEARLGRGARLRVVQLLNSNGVIRHEISADLDADSEFELLSIIVGDGDCYADNKIELSGDKSSFDADFGYLGKASQTIDMNLTVNQYGKDTKSKITASGALLGSAKKIFRGTIDFKKGSSGSTGSENENVLLLGDDITNKTVPIILCAEENVDGSHGATIGELDEQTLFYFESRGIDKAEAERVMSRAVIERPARLSGDAEFEEAVLSLLGEE